jgi:alpha-galactosidase/6-phospho-beta-glucosidase family protein
MKRRRVLNSAILRLPHPGRKHGLVAAVKAYELMTVEAVQHGDRDAAYQALLADPLGARADKVQAVYLMTC